MRTLKALVPMHTILEDQRNPGHDTSLSRASPLCVASCTLSQFSRARGEYALICSSAHHAILSAPLCKGGSVCKSSLPVIQCDGKLKLPKEYLLPSPQISHTISKYPAR